MMQRTGIGPLVRRVLIVDPELQGETGAVARGVRALAAELRARSSVISKSYCPPSSPRQPRQPDDDCHDYRVRRNADDSDPVYDDVPHPRVLELSSAAE